MTAVTRDEYECCRKRIVDFQHDFQMYLPVLKLRYENQINSVRRANKINNIDELITILEKRDCVSKNDISVLNEIAVIICLDTFLYNRKNNETAEKRNETTQYVSPNHTYNNNNNNDDQNEAKRRVHNTIINQIGTKWIDFARKLNVVENKIDTLKIEYSNNSKLCAKEVLMYHEENCVPREWKTRLLRALEKARRNDLKIVVTEIFDNYS